MPDVPDVPPGTAPQSSPRFRPSAPAALDADQRELHDRIAAGPRTSTPDVPLVDAAGALVGPFAIMTIAPAVGDAVQAVGAALRFAGSLPPVVREVAILMVAVHHRCDFEWMAHEAPARMAGVSDEAMNHLLNGEMPVTSDPLEYAAYATLEALLHSGGLNQAEYERARSDLGDRLLAELVWLHGYYSMLAVALAAFQPPLPFDRRVFT